MTDHPETLTADPQVLRPRRALRACFGAVIAALCVSACGQPASGPVTEPATTNTTEAEPTAQPPADPLAELRAEAPDGPLPQGVTPTAYTLDLVLNPRQERFSGVAQITLMLDEAMEGVWLHGKLLDVPLASVDTGATDTGAADQVPAIYTEVLDSGVARVSFREAVGPGEVTLTLRYTAAFDTQLAGLFRVQEGADWYALVKSESIQARRAFPGFDEPRFKTPFDISLTVFEGDVALSNTPVAAREPAAAGGERVVFETTPPLSTYLLSMAVGPFEEVAHPGLAPTDIRPRAVPVSGWARRGKGADMNYIMSLTTAMVEAFETKLGAPYPYAKLDIIAAPDWPSGATELAAAPTYREDIILVGDDPAAGAARRVFEIHAHEIAHMWFGDFVTMPWWDDLWLKEAFAVWGEAVAGMIMEPDAGFEMDPVRNALRGFESDALASARAVREPIAGNDDIRNAYDSITYSKGPAILAMAESYLGERVWQEGLQAYFVRFADGVADADDFYALMGEVSGDPRVAAMLESFIERPGAPLVTAELMCDDEEGPRVALSQSRYAPLGSSISPTETWTAPVCVRAVFDEESQARACVLMTDPTAVIALESRACPAWMMPNADADGYYRFGMDAAGWSALEAAFDDLTPREALAVVDSAAAAFEAGEVDAAALLRLFERAAEHPNRHVATAPLDALDRIRGAVAEASPQTEAYLAAFVQRVYGPRLRTLRDREPTPERALLASRLERSLALSGRDAELRADLAARAAAFVGLDRARDPEALSSDDYGLAVRVAAEDLGAPFVDAVLASRIEIDDPAFDRAALSALAYADAPDVAARLRAYALSDAAPARDAYSLILGQTRNADTRAAAWAWLDDNFAEVVQKVPAQWRRNLPRMAAAFCSSDKAAELDALFETKGALAPGHGRALDQTREAIALCAALRTAKAEEFAAALQASANP